MEHMLPVPGNVESVPFYSSKTVVGFFVDYVEVLVVPASGIVTSSFVSCVVCLEKARMA